MYSHFHLCELAVSQIFIYLAINLLCSYLSMLKILGTNYWLSASRQVRSCKVLIPYSLSLTPWETLNPIGAPGTSGNHLQPPATPFEPLFWHFADFLPLATLATFCQIHLLEIRMVNTSDISKLPFLAYWYLFICRSILYSPKVDLNMAFCGLT